MRLDHQSMRRSLLLGLVLLGALGISWIALRHRTTSPADGPVILISIDTLRADHLPVYGYRQVQTPNIDSLAADSVVFDRAYSHTPQTLPAHTSILSGQLPVEHGVRDNIGFTVKSGQWFVQRALHDLGWPTGGFVSAYVLRRATGIDQGFDTFDSDLPAASPELSIGQVQRDGALTLAAAEKWLDCQSGEPVLPVSPFLRAAQALCTASALCDVCAVQWRDRLRRRAGRPFARAPSRIGTLRSVDHPAAGGPWRRTRGSRRAGTRNVPLPGNDARPSDDQGGRPPQAPARRRTRSAYRCRADHPRFDRSANPRVLHGRSLKPLLDGTGTVADSGIYAEALYSGVSLRLERAVLADRYPLSIDPGAARRAVRPGTRSSRVPIDRGRAASGSSGHANRLERLIGGTLDRRAVGGIG